MRMLSQTGLHLQLKRIFHLLGFGLSTKSTWVGHCGLAPWTKYPRLQFIGPGHLYIVTDWRQPERSSYSQLQPASENPKGVTIWWNQARGKEGLYLQWATCLATESTITWLKYITYMFVLQGNLQGWIIQGCQHWISHLTHLQYLNATF